MILNRKSSEAEILENFGLLNMKILNPQEKLLENLVTNFVLEVDISLFKFSSSFKKEEPAYHQSNSFAMSVFIQLTLILT